MLEKHVYSDPNEVVEQPVALTSEDLERDYKYHMAVRLTKMLLEEGQITQEEYEEICRQHVKNYCPTLAPLIP